MRTARIIKVVSTIQNHPTTQWIAALVVLVGFTTLYYATRATIHTYDAFTYIVDVESKPLSGLYHPHHLLYGPTGYFTVRIATLLGYSGYFDAPMQFVNATAGALGVLAFWRFGARFTGHVWASLGAAALVGACYGYWVYAAEVEVYTLAALFIIITLWILAVLTPHNKRRMTVLLGLATAGAVMFHQTNSMFVAPVAAFLLCDTRFGWRSVALYLAVTGIAVALPYGLVALASNLTTWGSFYTWASGYVQTNRWGSNLSFNTLPALRAGLSQVVSAADGRYAALFYALAALGAGVGGRDLWKHKRPWVFFVVVWLGLYGGFFWWWEPWNIEFWIVMLPFWAMLMLVGVRGISHKTVLALYKTMPFILAALLLRGHYTPVKNLSSTPERYYYDITLALKPHLHTHDLVITRGNILDLYVPYYTRHSESLVVSLSTQNYVTGDYEAVMDHLLGTLRHAHNRGQIVFIDQILLDEPRSAARNPFGLEQRDIDTLRAIFPIFEAVTYNGQNTFYTIGERTAPTAISWTFSRDLQGWLAFAAHMPQFENSGWCFSGGGDIWLESPPVQIDSSRYAALHVDMEIQDTAEFGQLFWGQDSRNLSEEHSIRFPLQTGRYTYTVSLEDAPGWEGIIPFLRFDPIPDNLNVETCVYSITFIASP